MNKLVLTAFLAAFVQSARAIDDRCYNDPDKPVIPPNGSTTSTTGGTTAATTAAASTTPGATTAATTTTTTTGECIPGFKGFGDAAGRCSAMQLKAGKKVLVEHAGSGIVGNVCLGCEAILEMKDDTTVTKDLDYTCTKNVDTTQLQGHVLGSMEQVSLATEISAVNTYVSKVPGMACKKIMTMEELTHMNMDYHVDNTNNVLCITGDKICKDGGVTFTSVVPGGVEMVIKIEKKLEMDYCEILTAGTMTHRDILWYLPDGASDMQCKAGTKNVIHGTIYSQKPKIKLTSCTVVGAAIATNEVLEVRSGGQILCSPGSALPQTPKTTNNPYECGSYKDSTVTHEECTGDGCLEPQSCVLKRGSGLFKFEEWPEREDVWIQIKVLDTGVIYNFTNTTTGFPTYMEPDAANTDNYMTLPQFYIRNTTIFNDLYNSQYRDGIAMQFVSKRGPGGWNTCKYSPIGLDLDMDGTVEMINGDFDIDIDGNANTGTGANGDEELNTWFGPTVGILVYDPPADGVVTGKHLLGDMGGIYPDGYAKLATFDLNSDGWVNGDELKQFHLWIDANSNAHLDAGELRNLTDYGIVSLSTKHDCHESVAMLSSGKEMKTHDLWFWR